MIKVICHKNNPPHDWDEQLVSSQNEVGLCQSSYWLRVRQKIDHANPLLIEVMDDERCESILSVLLFHTIPWNRHKNRRSYKALLTMEWQGSLEWMQGPAVYTTNDDEYRNAMEMLLDWVDDYAVRKHLAGIHVQCVPFQNGPGVTDNDYEIFTKYGFTASRWGTYLIDLSKDIEILWKELNPSAREKVNRARRMNAHVRRMSSLEEFKEHYYLPYKICKSRAGICVNPWSVAEITWEEDGGRYYNYYVAKSQEEETLAMWGMYYFNGVATGTASALSPEAISRKIPAQDLLHWEMILEAKRAGCHTFDLAGVNPSPSTSKEEGIRKYKKKWGGQYIEYSRFEKVFPRGRVARAVRSVARYVRSKVNA